MAKYLFVYHGGKHPESEQEKAKAMDAWGQWFGSMGSDVIDGGSPVGPSTVINSDLSVANDEGSNPASGYSLIEAADIDDALTKAKACPIYGDGGSVEIAEAFDM